jgi:hypothetical protein
MSAVLDTHTVLWYLEYSQELPTYLGLPLITRDRRLQAAGIPTIW